jgi:hypothetical protein
VKGSHTRASSKREEEHVPYFGTLEQGTPSLDGDAEDMGARTVDDSVLAVGLAPHTSG